MKRRLTRNQWLGVLVALLAALVAPRLLQRASSSEAGSQPAPLPAETTQPVPAAASEPLELEPHQRLFGRERAADVDYCDDANWSRIDRFVERVDGDDVYVYAEPWDALTARTRLGIASWAVRCRNQGDAVTLREAGSQRVLAAYDARSGYSDLAGGR